MVSPNEKSLVNGNEINVSLLGSGVDVFIAIRAASGRISHPTKVSIEALLKGGMSERDALKYVMGIAVCSATATTS